MSGPPLHIDFETRSTVDLRKEGVHVYVNDPTTDILMACYAFDDGPVHTWYPFDPLPKDVIDHIRGFGIVSGHNVTFERLVVNHIAVPRYGWPRISIRQTRCTMARAFAMALPGTLDGASAAVNIKERKDLEGHRIMMQLSKPRRIEKDCTVVWWDDEEKLERLAEYCRQDVIVERELGRRLLHLSPFEQELWFLDQHINDRGVGVDLEAVEKAIDITEIEQRRLNALMKTVSKGAIATCNAVGQINDFLKFNGVETDTIGKANVAKLLEGELPDNVREVLLLRQEAAKSSTAKLKKMQLCAVDGRVQGMFQYHGAATGRWAGRKIQPQNLPRSYIPQETIDSVFNLLHRQSAVDARNLINILFGNPLDVLSQSLRGFLWSPNSEFIAFDFSNIEGRVLAWLAGEKWKIEAFNALDRGTGPDLYKVMASRIYGVPVGEVNGFQRLIGKVAELACGYQGGVGAFQSMAPTYQVYVDDTQADQIKTLWRERNPNIVKFWEVIENLAHAAVANPGRMTVYECEGVVIRFKVQGSFLFCQLPSGRVLSYAYPKLQEVKVPWGTKIGITYKGVDSVTKKWGVQKTYGGKLVENITQAVARDILAEAMRRIAAKGMRIVMHVHDEVVVEMTGSEELFNEVRSLMTQTPSWAKGLPISVGGYMRKRYKK